MAFHAVAIPALWYHVVRKAGLFSSKGLTHHVFVSSYNFARGNRAFLRTRKFSGGNDEVHSIGHKEPANWRRFCTRYLCWSGYAAATVSVGELAANRLT